jgi:hypothetical protein
MANEANALRDFIAAEVVRRSKTSTSIATLTAGTQADDAWWESVRNNLAKIVSTTSGSEATVGNKITAAQRDKLKEYAVAAYNTLVPVD